MTYKLIYLPILFLLCLTSCVEEKRDMSITVDETVDLINKKDSLDFSLHFSDSTYLFTDSTYLSLRLNSFEYQKLNNTTAMSRDKSKIISCFYLEKNHPNKSLIQMAIEELKTFHGFNADEIGTLEVTRENTRGISVFGINKHKSIIIYLAPFYSRDGVGWLSININYRLETPDDVNNIINNITDKKYNTTL